MTMIEDSRGARLQRGIQYAADYTGLTTTQIRRGGRFRAIARARWAIFLALRQECGWTLQEIGKAFGFDHRTVTYGLISAEKLMAKSELYTSFVTKMAAAVRG